MNATKRFAAIYMIFMMIMSLLCFRQAEAKIKNIQYKETKVEEKILRNTMFTCVSISKGKYYSLKRFVSILKNSKRYDVSCVSSDMKEDKEPTLSGKGLTIRKQSFKAVKTGTFRLKIKVNGSSYVFPLRVVEPYYQMDFQDVGKISLKKYVMWKSTTVFVEDADVIYKIMHEINRARYSFDVEYSLRSPVGCDEYFVSLYSRDGRILESIVLCPHEIMKTRSVWVADSSTTKECFDYINAIYNDDFSKLPEQIKDL